MDFVLQPWQLCVCILAGWVNRQQQEVIEYLRTENNVLREKFGQKRILLSDDQRKISEYSGLADADPERLTSTFVERGILTPFQQNSVLGREPVPLQLGPYVLVNKIGAGGMGTIFKAHSRELGHPVALKVLAVHSGLSAEARARFEREAHALGRLSHPNIVTLLDVGEEGQC